MPDIQQMSLTDVCEALQREPLLSMSLGSKELFHSNILVWFAQQLPDAARETFRSWTGPSAQSHIKGHERESAHLDAILRFDGLLPIVIENKMFSVPDQGQLEQYLARFDAELTAGSHILLTLMDPGFDAKNWRVMRYAELADAMDAQLSGIDTSQFAGQVVRHYVGFIRLLQRVMDTVGTPAGGHPLPLARNQAQLLDAIRMDAAVQKARASWVAAEIRRQLGSEAGEVRINSGFTNGRALVEGFCEMSGVVGASEADPDKRDSIGWQLQGDQFRLAVITYKFPQRSPLGRRERETYVQNTYDDWFDLEEYVTVTARTDSLVATRRRGGEETHFQGYDPNFSYRYVRCSGLNVDQIVRLGTAYSRAAIKYVQR